MSHSEKADIDDPQFYWGKQIGIGGSQRNIHYYETFTYDGVDYSLYDNVYLYKEGEHEPYIGKILKIWEDPEHKKKVKVLWFFRPTDIFKYLGDYEPLKKELFLASGEGVGLFNVNPLDSIAGKCRVICKSEDKRNPQPSTKELEMAEYIFYRTFDVGTYTLSDKIGDTIAGVEVRYLFNWKEDQKPSYVFDETNGSKGNRKTDANTSGNQSKSNSLRVLNDEKPGGVTNSVFKDDGIEGKQLLDEKTIPNLESDFAKGGRKPGKDLTHPGVYDDWHSKKMGLNDHSLKSSEDLWKTKTDTSLRKLRFEFDEEKKVSAVSAKTFEDKDKPTLVKNSVRLDKESSGKLKFDEKSANPFDESLLKASPPNVEKDAKAECQNSEVTGRPDVDRSKWFKGLPWDVRIQKADVQGTLLLLSDLDPTYTSGDIEDIIYASFKQKCTAKVIQHATFQSPNYGQAYVIFETSKAADLAAQKIDKECLMLPNGRPLVASQGMLRVPGKSSAFCGHLSIARIKLQMQREEMRNAVSTSHCSQPNTIEYEMALDWMLLREKSDRWWEHLHEKQSNELNFFRKRLKTN